MEDWKEYNIADASLIPLTDLVEFIVDNRGKTVPTASTGIKLIATNCIRNEYLYPLYEKVRFVSEDIYNTWFRSHPKPGDIIFVNKGTPGKCALVPDPVDFCIAQDMMAFRLKSDIVYNKYLLAILRSREIQSFIMNNQVGTIIPHFKKEQLKTLMIPLPKMQIQKRIGDFYFNISEKAEINRRINENLEQQAQALFKSWFVDFEPFRDQPFVESELGMIPQGWKVVELGDLVEIIDNRGKTPPLVSKDLYPIIDVKALTGLGRVLDYNKCSKYVNHETYTSWFRSGHPKKYDILLSTVGSLAETKLFMGGNGCIAQNVVALRNIDYSLYLYDYLNRIKSDLVAYNIGSVQPSIKITHIVKHKIIVPQAKVLERYQILSRKLTESICNYCSEIDNLSSLRDELLPKLMSGEIEIN